MAEPGGNKTEKKNELSEQEKERLAELLVEAIRHEMRDEAERGGIAG